MDYPGIDGFLGSRASLMLDVVFLAMFIVVPIMAWSIMQVKYKRRFVLHKRVQIGLGLILLLAITAFEVDMRINGWRIRAEVSPYYDPMWSKGLVNWSLWVHLVFAITTCILWILVFTLALRKFPKPPRPSAHSKTHIVLGRLAAIDMFMTALTGWVFYWFAFVAI